jgi:type 1 glutamine amidotransferase
MKKPIYALSFAAAILASATLSHADEIKALYVTGGGWHDYENQQTIISEGLKASIPNIDITINFVNDSNEHVAYEDENWAEGYDIVIYNKCIATNAEEPEWVERIVAPHRKGLPAVVLHCTMHCFRPDANTEWHAFLGVRTKEHERHHPITVSVTNTDHPVTKDLPEEWTTPKGELYRILEVGENTTELAMGTTAGDVDHLVIWTNQYGEGKVFGTTLGHHNETMASDEYQLLLKNGVLWALGEDE